jgi:23S rRNA (cytidine1920-2'-O)/16S rRNA (cytidine1409-2'-O)-methyltransferase
MTISIMPEFVSRAGAKLDCALTAFALNTSGKICADLGCSTGGFADCLLQRGAAKVYAIDTGYGVLDWKLRKDPRVIVMERTNAMHTTLPEPVDLVTIDVAWTRQRRILPGARAMLRPGGCVVTLVKPQYEADRALLREGLLPEKFLDSTIQTVREEIESIGWLWENSVRSPIRGTGGNIEMLVKLILRA